MIDIIEKEIIDLIKALLIIHKVLHIIVLNLETEDHEIKDIINTVIIKKVLILINIKNKIIKVDIVIILMKEKNMKNKKCTKDLMGK